MSTRNENDKGGPRLHVANPGKEKSKRRETIETVVLTTLVSAAALGVGTFVWRTAKNAANRLVRREEREQQALATQYQQQLQQMAYVYPTVQAAQVATSFPQQNVQGGQWIPPPAPTGRAMPDALANVPPLQNVGVPMGPPIMQPAPVVIAPPADLEPPYFRRFAKNLDSRLKNLESRLENSNDSNDDDDEDEDEAPQRGRRR